MIEVVWVLLLLVQTVCGSEETLREYLIVNQNRKVRPTQSNNQSVNIVLGLRLYQLIDVNDKEESLKISAWITMKWKDERMSWNVSEYDAEINYESNEVWKPDIVLFNSVGDEASSNIHMNQLHTDVVFNHNGEASWASPMVFTTRCRIDVEQFPFDEQHCYLKFASWTHSVKRMNVSGEEIDTRYYNSNQEWNLAGVETIRKEVEYPPATYAQVEFHIVLERRTRF